MVANSSGSGAEKTSSPTRGVCPEGNRSPVDACHFRELAVTVNGQQLHVPQVGHDLGSVFGYREAHRVGDLGRASPLAPEGPGNVPARIEHHRPVVGRIQNVESSLSVEGHDQSIAEGRPRVVEAAHLVALDGIRHHDGPVFRRRGLGVSSAPRRQSQEEDGRATPAG